MFPLSEEPQSVLPSTGTAATTAHHNVARHHDVAVYHGLYRQYTVAVSAASGAANNCK